MRPVIAIDFGGTHIRAALFPTEKPNPTKRVKERTMAEHGPDQVLDRMVGIIETIKPSTPNHIEIGLASPGILDRQREKVVHASNLPGWDNYPLKKELEARTQTKVHIENDSLAAGMGEYRFGAGQGANPMIYLTLGTGIGGALIVDGKSYQGVHGLAPEMGHMTIDPDGPLCSCGKRGHIEAIASGLAISHDAIRRVESGEASLLKQVLRRKGRLSAEDISHAASMGDVLASEVINAAASAIGTHLAGLVHALNPARIVIGGGLTQMGDLLLNPIREKMVSETIHPIYLKDLDVLPAKLGDDAGLVGAMILARES